MLNSKSKITPKQFKAKVDAEVYRHVREYRDWLSEAVRTKAEKDKKKQEIEEQIRLIFYTAETDLFHNFPYEIARKIQYKTVDAFFRGGHFRKKKVEELLPMIIQSCDEPDGSLVYQFRGLPAYGFLVRGILDVDKIPEPIRRKKISTLTKADKDQLKEIILSKEREACNPALIEIFQPANKAWKDLAQEFLDAAEALSVEGLPDINDTKAIYKLEARIALELQEPENEEAQQFLGPIVMQRIAKDEDDPSIAGNNFETYYKSAVEERYAAITAHIEAPEDVSKLQNLKKKHSKVEKIHKTLHFIVPNKISEHQVETDSLVSQILDGFTQYFIEAKQGREHGSVRVKQITRFFEPKEVGAKPLTLKSIVEKLAELEQALVDEDAGSWFLRSASRSRLFKLADETINKLHENVKNNGSINELFEKAKGHKEILISSWREWVFQHGCGTKLRSPGAAAGFAST